MILIATQLLPPLTSNSNNLGAKGRKSCGRRHDSSQITFTMADVTLGSSFSSSKRSFIFGQAGLNVSGYTKANLYKVTIVFFRMAGLECVKRGSRSPSKELAMEGFMTWGIAVKASVMVLGAADIRSCPCQRDAGHQRPTYLLEQVLGKHQDLGIRSEALDSSQIAHALLNIVCRRHDLEDMEGSPRHIVAKHFQIGELEKSGGLEAHVVGLDLLAAFAQTGLDIFLLVAFLVAQTSDEVVERLFEPMCG